jgi:hypothetical protein
VLLLLLLLLLLLVLLLLVLVGRAPWPAADPPVGLAGIEKSRTRASGADKAPSPNE